MVELVRDVDALLRGRFTRPADLGAGRIALPVRRLVVAAVAMGALYGVFMGLFAAVRGGPDGARQLAASMVKVPLLFLLTLVVTFPSLYVSSALSSSRLDAAATLRLLLTAIGVELALLASLGPVTGFFAMCTTSYAFMVLLNVLMFTISGVIGLAFLQRALASVFAPAAGETAPAARHAFAKSRRIFGVWLVIFAVVGAQMGWVLRPFIGDPRLPFTFFRSRTSNFFEACIRAFAELTG